MPEMSAAPTSAAMGARLGWSLGWSAARRRTLLAALDAGTLDTLEFEAVVYRAGPNRNHLRIRRADLPAFAASFVGAPFLRDHRVEDLAARAGVVVCSELAGGGHGSARRAALYIRQTIRLTTRRDMRAFLEGQIDRFSVAWFYDNVQCSVCGGEWGGCTHKPGRIYHTQPATDGAPAKSAVARTSARRVRCELVFINPRGKEVSAVNAPAVEGTGLLKQLDAEMQRKTEKGAERKTEKSQVASSSPSPAREGKGKVSSSPSPSGEGKSKVSSSPSPAREGKSEVSSSPSLSGEGKGEVSSSPSPGGEGRGEVRHRSFRIGTSSKESEMNETEWTAARAPVAQLAMGDEMPEQEEWEASGAPLVSADPWLAALREQVVDGLLARSGLSSAGMAVVRTALEGAPTLSPQHVQRVIEAQRAAEAQLGYSGRGQSNRSSQGSAGLSAGFSHAGRGVVHGVQPTITGMHTAEDEVQAALNWLLGDTRTPMPAPHLRNLRDVYLAVTGDINFWGAFNPDHARLQSAHSGTLTGMAVNALNKAVLLHYDNMITYRWYEPIVHVLPHDGTTQQMQLIHMDGIAALPAVAEGAAYTEATTGDSKETAAFTKYGSYVGITLEMIRRSDIARIQAIPRLLVQAAIRRRSATVAGIFTSNPTLADDATALFHANHGNHDTTAFSANAWEAARTRIFEQSLPGAGKPLGLWPTYCLLPIELYDDALTAFGYGSGDVGKPNAGGTAQEPNIYATSRPGDPRPVPIVVPDWTDATDWAYIVDPRLHPVLVMAYANATAGGAHALPEIFEVRSESAGLMFSHDTLPVKLRDWWAFGAATHIGIGRNVVA